MLLAPLAGHKGCSSLSIVAIALGVALLFYRMPLSQALGAAGFGFVYGLWPIAWIIIGAVFLYKVSVKTGQFDIIRASILSVTEDQRLQMLMVGLIPPLKESGQNIHYLSAASAGSARYIFFGCGSAALCPLW